MVVEKVLTIYGLALGHVAVVGIGQEAIPITTDDALEVAAISQSAGGCSVPEFEVSSPIIDVEEQAFHFDGSKARWRRRKLG